MLRCKEEKKLLDVITSEFNFSGMDDETKEKQLLILKEYQKFKELKMKMENLQDTEKNLEITEVSAIPNNDNGWLQKVYKDLAKASTAKQLTAGGLSGWFAGYIFTKVGKVMATALTGSIILFQLAQYKGYIKVNWTKMNKDLNHAKKELETQAKNRVPRIMEEGQRFVEENVILATGFAGGFVFGMVSA